MKTGRKIRANSKLSKGSQDLVILLIFYVIRCFIWLTAHMKEERVKSLVRLFYLPFSRFNRKVCRRNLTAVFEPLGRSPTELEQFYQAHLEYMIRFQVETARCFTIPVAELERKVLLEGEARLQESLKRGGGVWLVSGHMGTWWHAPFLLATRGYKVNVVFNSFPAPVEEYLERNAARHGVKVSFLDKGVPKLMQHAAKHNEIVFLTFDVAVRKFHRNWLPFGHTKININPGPALLALRNRTPVHFVSTHHQAQRSFAAIHPETVIGDIISVANPNILSQQWVENLYADILIHPEQWWGWGFSDLPFVRKRK